MNLFYGMSVSWIILNQLALHIYGSSGCILWFSRKGAQLQLYLLIMSPTINTSSDGGCLNPAKHPELAHIVL